MVGHPSVICVGRICRQKGQDVLVDAWSSVLRAVPEAELVLVGGSVTPSTLPAQLPPRVRLVGQKDDVAPWLQAADVVVAPSRWDGHSVVVLEAMACGRSVVATKAAGAQESLGDSGATVAIGQPNELAEAIITRLQDSDLREHEGKAARRRVESLYGAQACARRIGDLYSHVLDGVKSSSETQVHGVWRRPQRRSSSLQQIRLPVAETAQTPRVDRERLPSVCAVVVTYGSRDALCRRAAESALRAGVHRAIIVDNGADARSREELETWAGDRVDVAIVSLGRNTGSAYGFGQGMEAGLADGAEYLWLLDDDSDVDVQALCELAWQAERLLEAGHPLFALVSLRWDLPLLRSLANGHSVNATYPSRSSFPQLQHTRPPSAILSQLAPSRARPEPRHWAAIRSLRRTPSASACC